MSIYSGWGFRSSPFETTALPASELGEKLLIGRATELRRLSARLSTPPMATTVEGANGVGKTSLINVAIYKQFASYFASGKGQLLIPCEQIFQLSATSSAAELEAAVYRAVAQTLITKAKEIESESSFPDTSPLDKWLNHPQLENFQGGLQFGVATGNVGGSFGTAHETNTSDGFLKSGFPQQVKQWLRDIFPNPEVGAVVCVIDNLELLQTSQNARRVLEEIRDTLLVVPGLRWVLCGALGIVRAVANSPRLQGYLHDPIDIMGVDDSDAPKILRSRIDAFAENIKTAYVPITERDFETLYDVFNRNIRHALSALNSYCLWVADRELPSTDEAKNALFNQWLDGESDAIHDAVQRVLRPRGWQTFERALDMGGEFSPSDFEDFGFNSIQALRPHVKELEEAALVTSVQDESDKRRKTIQVTSKGWMVNFARARRRTNRQAAG